MEKYCSDHKINIVKIAGEILFRSQDKYCSDHKRNFVHITREIVFRLQEMTQEEAQSCSVSSCAQHLNTIEGKKRIDI